VGALVAVIDFSLVWILSHWLSPLLAVSVAYITAVSCHYLLSKTWIYSCHRRDHAKQIGQYAMSIAASWLLMLGVVQLCLSTVTTNVLIAKLVAAIPVTLVGFVLLRSFVFTPKKEFGVDLGKNIPGDTAVADGGVLPEDSHI
jgi:putative flippase GtrA